jgi:MalT-like TPR region
VTTRCTCWRLNEADDLASLAHIYVENGEPERAKETAERGLALAREQGSRSFEVLNLVALLRAEVALGHEDAVDPLLANAAALIAAMGALTYLPHLAEIRAARARRRGDQTEWRAQLAEALQQARIDFPVLCHTLPPSATVDGVLGLDFMRGQRLIVDLRAATVSLE